MSIPGATQRVLALSPGRTAVRAKTLLGISKRGNRYIRTLLIHGARAVLRPCQNKNDKLSLWLQSLMQRRGYNVAAVALANKNARILWALAYKEERYQAAVSG
jgi:transposase